MTGSAVVGPSVTTFYAQDDVVDWPGKVRAFLEGCAGTLVSGTTWSVPNGGDIIDPENGKLTGVWTSGAVPAPVVGASAGTYAQGVGAQVRWRTTGIVAGRRVVGSTFIVPLTSGAFETNGTLLAAVVTASNSAAAAYISSTAGAVIWSRPTPDRVGSQHLITSGFMPDRTSWLRTRRT
jgi:hypothetical protein